MDIISSISCEDGNLYTSKVDISKVAQNYFKNLYCNGDAGFDVVICRNLPFDGMVKAKINKPKHSSPREKMRGFATNIYSRKTLEKPKRGLRILKKRVRELFTHREGISTPCARHKGRQL